MAKDSFAPALAAVLVHEGGYSNHPADPGGPTMKGIIQRVYDAWRRSKGLPTRPVRDLEDAELKDIYRRQYWDAVRADELPPGIDYVVFDGAVNSGPGQSAKWLQRALGLPADGQVGAVTLAAARAAAASTPEQLVDDICDRRLAMLKALSTWPVFGRGWGRRVADVRRKGKNWTGKDWTGQDGTGQDGMGQDGMGQDGSGGVDGPIPVHDAVSEDSEESAKAPVSSARPAPRPEKGASAVAGGVVASAVAEAARQVEPYAAGSSTLASVFSALTLLGLALTLGGLAYVWWCSSAGTRRISVLDLLPEPGGEKAGTP